jgi:hypothetical protein
MKLWYDKDPNYNFRFAWYRFSNGILTIWVVLFHYRLNLDLKIWKK